VKNAYIIIAYVKLGGITLSCDKCEDIHIAQRAGKQNDECKCGCHNTIIQPWHWDPQPWIWNPQPYTGDPIPPQYETICSNDLFGIYSDNLFREFKKKDDRNDLR